MRPISNDDILGVLSVVGAIPSSLWSLPMRERHRFLAVDVSEDPVGYYSWPGPDSERAVELLLGNPRHDPPFLVQYAADPKTLFAHVRITPELRLVFLYQDNCWLFHNTALMPFPANSYQDFSAAVAVISPDDFLQEQEYTVTVPDDSEDDYWNSYDQPHTAKQEQPPAVTDEDAYWAQYNNVQGSGDSTIPSPRLPKKTLEDEVPAEGRTLVPSGDLQRHHEEPYNPFQPPSPDALSRRLQALSDGSASPPALIDDIPDSEPSDTPPRTTEVSPIDAKTIEFEQRDVGNPAQDILKDNIRSLYRLWTLTHPVSSGDDSKTLFLETVRRSLEQL